MLNHKRSHEYVVSPNLTPCCSTIKRKKQMPKTLYMRRKKSVDQRERSNSRNGSKPKKVSGGLGHDGGELIEANDTITVGIGLTHHLGEL